MHNNVSWRGGEPCHVTPSSFVRLWHAVSDEQYIDHNGYWDVNESKYSIAPLQREREEIQVLIFGEGSDKLKIADSWEQGLNDIMNIYPLAAG